MVCKTSNVRKTQHLETSFNVCKKTMFENKQHVCNRTAANINAKEYYEQKHYRCKRK